MNTDTSSNWSIRITLPEAIGIESMSNLLNYTIALDSLGQYGSGYSQNDVVLLCIRHALRNKDLLNLVHTRVVSKTDVKNLYVGNDSIFSTSGLNIEGLIFEPSARSFKIDRETERELIELIEEWGVKSKSDLLRVILASVFTSIDEVIKLSLRAYSALILLNIGVSFFQNKLSRDEIKNYTIRNECPKITFTKYEISSMEKMRKNYQHLNTFKKYQDAVKERTSAFTNVQTVIPRIFSDIGNIDPKSYSPYSINDLLMPSLFQEFSTEFIVKLIALSLIYSLNSLQPIGKPPKISTILDYFAVYKIRGNSSLDDGVSQIYDSFIHPHLIIEMNELIGLVKGP